MVRTLLLFYNYYHCNLNKYFIYTAKNRSAEYIKSAGINLRAVIKYFKINKKKKTIVHSKRSGKTNIYNNKGVKQLNKLIYQGAKKVSFTACHSGKL